MESWQEDRIWIWLIAASKNDSNEKLRFFIDLDKKTLFILERVNNGWATASYFGRSNHHNLDSNLQLKGSIKNIKNENPAIIEYPLIDVNFPKLEDPNAHFFTNKKEHLTRMHDDYRRMKFAEKVLKELGLQVKDLTLI